MYQTRNCLNSKKIRKQYDEIMFEYVLTYVRWRTVFLLTTFVHENIYVDRIEKVI